jgi:hypothetical protein
MSLTDLRDQAIFKAFIAKSVATRSHCGAELVRKWETRHLSGAGGYRARDKEKLQLVVGVSSI